MASSLSCHGELADESRWCRELCQKFDVTFWGQLQIMRMKGSQTILGECCTWCMLHLENAALTVNSSSWHGKIESDDITSCSVMIVQLWMRKRAMADKDENDIENTSEYEKSGVQLA